MVQVLFYRGHDLTPEGAISKALQQCGDILKDNPSLVVQLESLTTCGHTWDADIRVMALDTSDDAKSPARRKGRPQSYEMKNPEHAKSGNPNEWRPVGMEHDPQPVAFRFGNAAIAGELPDLPIQEIVVPGSDPTRHTVDELRRLLWELEEIRLNKRDHPENDLT